MEAPQKTTTSTKMTTTKKNVKVTVRESTPEDIPALDRLYAAAFPDEDLLPLLHGLLRGDGTSAGYALCSLVAVVDDDDVEAEEHEKHAVIGSILFTACAVHRDGRGRPTDDDDDDARVALLGPLCVAPSRQGRGHGSLLVREGIRRMGEVGLERIVVLGSPAFYGRFGFRPLPSSDGPNVRPPYPLPERFQGAWQSLDLPSARGGEEAGGPEDSPSIRGTLIVPKPWQDRTLWGA
jgi:putative acetyltransferase